MKNKLKVLVKVLPVLVLGFALVGCSSNQNKDEVIAIYKTMEKSIEDNASYTIHIESKGTSQDYYFDGVNVKLKHNSADNKEDYYGYYVDGKSYLCVSDACTEGDSYDFKESLDDLQNSFITKVLEELEKTNIKAELDGDSYKFNVTDGPGKDSMDVVLTTDNKSVSYDIAKQDIKVEVKITDVEKVELPNK